MKNKNIRNYYNSLSLYKKVAIKRSCTAYWAYGKVELVFEDQVNLMAKCHGINIK